MGWIVKRRRKPQDDGFNEERARLEHLMESDLASLFGEIVKDIFIDGPEESAVLRRLAKHNPRIKETLARHMLRVGKEGVEAGLSQVEVAMGLETKGGAGSGNFGHAGRPGKRGGSVGGGGHAALEQNYGVLPRNFESNPDDFRDKEWVSGLSREEKQAIRNYTQSSYSINSVLRQDVDVNDYWNESEKLTVKHLNSVLERASIPNDGYVFRGISGKWFPKEKGTTYTDRAFMSTSASPEVAINWGRTQIMRIAVKKGQKGAYIDDVSLRGGEKELILPRNSVFTIVGVRKIQHFSGEITVTDVEYIGQNTIKSTSINPNADIEISRFVAKLEDIIILSEPESTKAAPTILFPTDADWTMANEAVFDWLVDADDFIGTTASRIIDTNENMIRQAIAEWLLSGESLDALVDTLARTAFGPRRATAIAVTEVTRVFARANLEAWRETGVIQQRRWQTANDELVCAICGPMNQQIVGMDEPFSDEFRGGELDGPPAHVRCRCWVTPVATPAHELTAKGGAGSGNFGHVGRPGKRGGSAGGNRKISQQDTTYLTSNGDDEVSKKLIERRGNLSESQELALSLYISESGYYNTPLRSGFVPPETTPLGQRISAIDQMMIEIPENINVYRGVKDISFLPGVGESFQDLGYMSTSLTDFRPRRFMEDRGTKQAEPALLRIKVKKGSKGLYLEGVESRYSKDKEFEVLLPRGSTIRIDAISKDSFGATIVDATYE